MLFTWWSCYKNPGQLDSKDKILNLYSKPPPAREILDTHTLDLEGCSLTFEAGVIRIAATD